MSNSQPIDSNTVSEIDNKGTKSIIQPSDNVSPCFGAVSTIEEKNKILKMIKDKCGVDLEVIDGHIGEITSELKLLAMTKDVRAVYDKLSDPLMVEKIQNLVLKIKSLSGGNIQCVIDNMTTQGQTCRQMKTIEENIGAYSENMSKIIKLSKLYSETINQLITWKIELLADISKKCGGDPQKIRDIGQLSNFLSTLMISPRVIERSLKQRKKHGYDALATEKLENFEGGESFNEGVEAATCVANSWDSCSMYGYTTLSFSCCCCCCCLIIICLILYMKYFL